MGWIIGGLLIATGLVSAAVGMLLARRCVHQAYRLYHRTASLSTSPEGWDGWFLGGFSAVSTGTQWLIAVAAWCVWTLAGLGFVVLGITLFDRL